MEGSIQVKKKVVNIYLRKSGPGQFSIEKLFLRLAEEFKGDDLFDVNVISMPYLSQGIYNRIRNIFFAWRQKADIHHISGDIHYIIFAFKHSKSLITIHDLALIYHLKALRLLIFKTIWFTIPTWWANKLVVISEKTKSDLIRFINPDYQKIKIISNFIDKQFYTNYKVKELNEVPIILHVGTAPHKNLVRLIDAINGLSIKLHIVGVLNEDYLVMLKRGNVQYSNFTNLSEQELIDQYRQADVVYFASTFEGFGMPILEGQAMGVPIITSNVAPMKDVASDGSAYLVNPFVASEIRNAILDIIQNQQLRMDLVKNGFKNVRKYGVDQIMGEYRSVYLSMIKPQ